MTQNPMTEAQDRLPALIAMLSTGESIQITEGDQPVACLIREAPAPRRARVPGSAVGLLTIVSDDDDHRAVWQA